jgi:hypothetical protein
MLLWREFNPGNKYTAGPGPVSDRGKFIVANPEVAPVPVSTAFNNNI